MHPREVSVVLACHDERRWDAICRALESIAHQQHGVAEVAVAVDHNRSLFRRLATLDMPVTAVLNDSSSRGAAATRNAGAAAISTEFTAFLDDDEYAEPSWIDELLAPFESDDVVGTGGCYRPQWLAGKPAWFPDEFAWAVGGSYTGMPVKPTTVRNVWSGNMAVRTKDFLRVGGFRSGFGKIGGQSRPEDTDLCIRMSRSSGGRWMYVPSAIIDHQVPRNRSTFGFYLRRSFAEGAGKIEMRQLLAGNDALDTERSYLTRTVPMGILRHLRSGPVGAVRAGALAIGVTAAATGAICAVTTGSMPRRAVHTNSFAGHDSRPAA